MRALAVLAMMAACVSAPAQSPELGPLSLGDAGLDAGYRAMYNRQFERAHIIFADWGRAHADDPMAPVSDAAAYLFSEFDRLHILEVEFFTNDKSFQHQKQLSPDPATKSAFFAALDRAGAAAERALKSNPKDSNARLAKILALGLRGDYEALIEKRNIAGLKDMKQSRGEAETLTADDPNCYDAYLAVGVENYLLSLRAAPVRLVLWMSGAETNKELGLQKLRLTAEKGHYLQAYARLLLAVAALRDNQKDRARQLLSELAQAFPENPLYRRELSLIK